MSVFTGQLPCDYIRQNEEILSSEALQGRHSGPNLLSVKHARAVEGVTNFYLRDTLSPSHGQPATTTVMVKKAVVISVIVGVAAGTKAGQNYFICIYLANKFPCFSNTPAYVFF